MTFAIWMDQGFETELEVQGMTIGNRIRLIVDEKMKLSIGLGNICSQGRRKFKCHL